MESFFQILQLQHPLTPKPNTPTDLFLILIFHKGNNTVFDTWVLLLLITYFVLQF